LGIAAMLCWQMYQTGSSTLVAKHITPATRAGQTHQGGFIAVITISALYHPFTAIKGPATIP